MMGTAKWGWTLILSGLILAGCATADPCVNILQEKPLEPGIKMNSVTIVDTSLYSEMVGATYCEGQRVGAPTTAEMAAQQNPVVRFKISVEQSEFRRTPTGTMEVLTILRNHTNFPLQIEGKTHFFDKNKSPGEVTAWQRVQLPPKGIGTYKAFSTQGEEAHFYHIEIREGR
ncbi:MAG: hypothetical protein ACE5E9_06385 [Nitrospinaceae bacterium]